MVLAPTDVPTHKGCQARACAVVMMDVAHATGDDAALRSGHATSVPARRQSTTAEWRNGVPGTFLWSAQLVLRLVQITRSKRVILVSVTRGLGGGGGPTGRVRKGGGRRRLVATVGGGVDDGRVDWGAGVRGGAVCCFLFCEEEGGC